MIRTPTSPWCAPRKPASLASARLGDSKALAAWPARRGDRQSARLRIDRDGRRGLGLRALDALGDRTAHRRHHPDGRRLEPRQFRRPARLERGRGGRHQHGRDPRGARHLLCGRLEYRKLCARRARAARARASRLPRPLGRSGRDRAPHADSRMVSIRKDASPSRAFRRTARPKRPACSGATAFSRSTA